MLTVIQAQGGTATEPVKLSDLDTHHRFIITAHRGDVAPGDGYPENTVAAMISAAEKGAHRVEMDPRKSEDGTWYLFHDATVDRTTDGTGNVVDLSDAELDALAIDGGVGYVSARHSGLYVPAKLSEVLTALDPFDVTLQLDNKVADDAAELATYITAQGWGQRVAINAYTQAEAQAIKAVNPDIAVVGQTGWDEADYDTPDFGDTDYDTKSEIQAVAPLQIHLIDPASNWGTTDQAALAREAWHLGARGFSGWNVAAALAAIRRLEAGEPEDADGRPSTPATVDDEFDGSSTLNAKWTITNDPAGADAVSVTDVPGYLHVGLPELGTDNFDNAVRVHQTPPTGTATMEFVAKIALTADLFPASGEESEFAGAWVYLGDSANDEMVGAGIYLNNSVSVNTPLRVNPLADNGAGGFGSMSSGINEITTLVPGEFYYVKLVKSTASAYTSSNTYSAYFSANGLIWHQMGTMAKTFTGACDEVGLIFRRPKSQTGTPHCEALVDFFRKTA